jgi:hypothetical protein
MNQDRAFLASFAAQWPTPAQTSCARHKLAARMFIRPSSLISPSRPRQPEGAEANCGRAKVRHEKEPWQSFNTARGPYLAYHGDLSAKQSRPLPPHFPPADGGTKRHGSGAFQSAPPSHLLPSSARSGREEV